MKLEKQQQQKKKTYSKFFNNFQKHLASAITKLNVGAGWEQYT